MAAAYFIGTIVGALIATYLISRLWLWVIGRFVRLEPGRQLLAYVGAWVSCMTLAAFGFAEAGQPAWSRAFLTYTPALAVWLLVDLLAQRGRSAGPGKP